MRRGVAVVDSQFHQRSGPQLVPGIPQCAGARSSADERSRRPHGSGGRRFHSGYDETSQRRKLLLLRLRTCSSRATCRRSRSPSTTQPLAQTLVEEARRVSRKALQRCAVVLTATGLVAADVGTITSVGWLSSRAAAMCFVMCSRWPPSAVPLADSSVFWVLLSSILVDQRPLTSPTDPHGARVLRERRGGAVLGAGKHRVCTLKKRTPVYTCARPIRACKSSRTEVREH